jgi:hypothetical protein
VALAGACIGAAIPAPSAFAAGAAPSIAEAQVTDVSEQAVDVSAVISTEEADTTYLVEYGESEAYGAVVPVGGRAIGLGNPETGKESVYQPLNGLSPGVTYHYRVVAENSYGTTATTDQVFTTFSAQPPGLSDGRAYELVSPPEKHGGEVAVRGEAPAQARSDGNAVAYQSFTAFGESQSNQVTEYIARRTPGGWITQSTSPPDSGFENLIVNGAAKGFSADLGTEVMSWDMGPLTPEAALGYDNIYLRDENTGAYTLLTKGTPSERGALPEFVGASADYRALAFRASGGFTENSAAGADNVYQWSNGQLALVSVPPGATDGVPAQAWGENAMSSDGRLVFWSDMNSSKGLYAWVNGQSTLKLNASRRSPSLGDGSANFYGATPSGKLAFFIDTTPLTEAAGDKGGLYEFDTATNELVDLTPDEAGTPQVQGVVGYGDDGAYVYFIANAALANGAVAGKENLYVAHGGAIALVAALSLNDESDWSLEIRARHAAVSADGTQLVFMSLASPTGYDNRDVYSGERDSEVFEYDAASVRLSCVSCNPTGERPLGSSKIPLWASMTYNSEYLTDGGARLFFESEDGLVPSDTNGQSDVYEWERDGTGSCEEAGGCLSLISSGVGERSNFMATAAGGNDAFFYTRDKLVATDLDEKVDLYDARVGGGFAESSGSTTAECAGEACLGPLSAPPAGALTLTSVVRPGEEAAALRRATFSVAGVGPRARRAAARSGTLTLRVAVSAAGRLSASATAELSGRRIAVAVASARARGAEVVPLVLTIGRAARAALARHGRLRITVAVAYSTADGSKRMTLTLGAGR